MPTVASPKFLPAGGSFPGAQAVTLQDATPGARMFYTLDGSTPTTSSSPYTGPISVSTTTTLKAIAVKAGASNSPVISATYTIAAAAFVQGATEMGATATLWFKPSATMNFVIAHVAVGTGSQNNPQMAWNPTLARWETIVNNLSPGTVIKYSFTYAPVAGAQQDTPSYAYTMGQDNGIDPAAFSPAAGAYPSVQPSRLSIAAANASIRYTLDGSAPNPLSATYTAPLAVSAATTINAISLLPDGSQSAVAMANYLIGTTGGTAAAPVFSQAGGTYATHVRLTMSTPTVGATLHYTTDGTTPSAASPIYGGPIEISATTTISAIALKAGMTRPR